MADSHETPRDETADNRYGDSPGIGTNYGKDGKLKPEILEARPEGVSEEDWLNIRAGRSAPEGAMVAAPAPGGAGGEPVRDPSLPPSSPNDPVSPFAQVVEPDAAQAAMPTTVEGVDAGQPTVQPEAGQSAPVQPFNDPAVSPANALTAAPASSAPPPKTRAAKSGSAAPKTAKTKAKAAKK